MNTAILDLIGRDAPSLAAQFGRMEIAEQEITAAKAHHVCGSAMHTALHDAFRYLGKTSIPLGRNERVYRAHVQEMLQRVERGLPLEPGTQAEVMVAISDATMASRLVGDAEFLYWRIFSSIFPEHDVSKEGCFREQYKDSSLELLNTLRRKLTMPRDCRMAETVSQDQLL